MLSLHRPGRRFLAMLLALIAVSPSAIALTLDATALEKALASAELVAEIEVTAKTAARDPVFGLRYEATARVRRVLESRMDDRDAPDAGEELTLVGPGGESDGMGVFLPGFARPHVGQRYRAHLSRRKDGHFEVVGFERGLTPTGATRQFSRNRTDGSNGEGNGAFLYWDPTFFPVPYYISAPTFTESAHFIPAIDASFKSWRDVPDTRQEFLAMGCTSVIQNGNDGINSILIVSQNWDFDPAAIAITRNFYVAGATAKSGQILDSDILLNAVDHTFSVDLSPGTHDVQNILTHEIGHFLGLGHEIAPSDVDAVMHAVASPNETKKRTLRANDIAGVRSAYPGAATRFAVASTSAACNLGTPTACVAVHARGRSLPGWGVLSLLVALGLVLAGGRVIARRSHGAI